MPPRKRKSLAPDTPLTPVSSEILDQFVGQGPLSVEELDAALRRFKKAIVERALGGELTHHLGYPPRGAKPEDVANHRNGRSPKTVLTDDGPLAIEVPRDRKLLAAALRPIYTAGNSLRSSSRIASRTPRRRMNARMDAAHSPSRFHGEDEINPPAHKISDTPPCSPC